MKTNTKVGFGLVNAVALYSLQAPKMMQKITSVHSAKYVNVMMVGNI